MSLVRSIPPLCGRRTGRGWSLDPNDLGRLVTGHARDDNALVHELRPGSRAIEVGPILEGEDIGRPPVEPPELDGPGVSVNGLYGRLEEEDGALADVGIIVLEP